MAPSVSFLLGMASLAFPQAQVPLLAASSVASMVDGVRTRRRAERARREGRETEMGDVLERHEVHPVRLEWRNIECSVQQKKKSPRAILRAVSGCAEAGRLMAILGPSGSGKTTLLSTLAGQVPYTKGMSLTGSITLNGTPQEDLFFSQLTVTETLAMAAQLRLPESTPVETINEYVDKIIARLGLSKARDTVVGDAKTRGLSGGEKKRLSIACELVGSTSVLFLDEPTSGLDAFQAERVMKTLKALAAAGHTVVCSIHQPRSSIFDALDDLVLLSEGRCLYAGPAAAAVSHFAALGHQCPPQYNPADFLIDLVSVDYSSAESEAETRARLETLADRALDSTEHKDGDAHDILVETAGVEAPRSGWLRQLKLLFGRSLRQSIRDKATNMARLSSSVGSAIIFGSIFSRLGRSQTSIQDRMGLLQVVAVNTAMSSMTKTLSVFPKERVIVSRERSKNSYAVAPYFAAKILAELPVGALFPAAFGALVYPACGLHQRWNRFLKFLGIITVESFASGAIGLTVGSIAPNTDTAMVLGPLISVIFIVFGGYYVNESTVPLPLRWVPKASLIRQGFEALCINEFSGLEFDASKEGDVKTGEQALARLGFDKRGGADPVVSLARILLFNYWMTYRVLKARKPRFQPLEATKGGVEDREKSGVKAG